MRATKQEVDRVLSNLSGAGIQELKRTLAALNHEIESGSVKRSTEEWKKYQKAIKEVNTELKKVREEQKDVNSSSTRWGDFLKKDLPFPFGFEKESVNLQQQTDTP